MKFALDFVILSLFCLSTTYGVLYTNETSIATTSGGWVTGGGISQVFTVGCSSHSTFSAVQEFVIYENLIGSSMLNQNLDTDNDGLTDEFDIDNDNDGLQDLDEITGSAFSPNTPTDVNTIDSDGDQSSDKEESLAGTNPNDPSTYLCILDALTHSDGTITLTWLARQGKEYHILAHDSPKICLSTNVIASSIGGTGSGPWLVTTNTYNDPNASHMSKRYYSIKVSQ